MCCVEKLIKAAESQPEAAHAVLTKSLQFEWAFFLQRGVPNCVEAYPRREGLGTRLVEAFVPRRDAINKKFLPMVLGGEHL